MEQFNFCPLLAKRLHFTLGDQLVDHNNRTSGEKRSRVRTGSTNIQQTTFQGKTDKQTLTFQLYADYAVLDGDLTTTIPPK